MTIKTLLLSVACTASTMLLAECKKKGSTPAPPTPADGIVEQWFTKTNQSELLKKQAKLLAFGTASNNYANLEIDENARFQTMDGFGYTLTGSSALLINNMTTATRSTLLQELFGSGETGIGISYLRLSLGASDLSPQVFSYNDLPSGQTDEALANFSLAADTTDLIPVLKQILALKPNIKLMASPWSAPSWMKSNSSSIGGSLLPKYYPAYAQYFVKYIKAMQARGIVIDAVTVQNEPQHGGNNPSMTMTASEQGSFVKNHLGPAFLAASITTKIIIWDHNCDNPNFPITILNDAAAKPFIDGSAFHLYAGDISALSTVHDAHPDKHLYFTEQWTGANGSFAGDLAWHSRNVIIGSARNWAKVVLEWNLASDPTHSLHTPGGCSECRGAITITGSNYTRNVAYYIVAQASKFVLAGSVRIGTTGPGNLTHVAFKTPEGKKALVVLNDGSVAVNFNIKTGGQWAAATIPAGTVATYYW